MLQQIKIFILTWRKYLEIDIAIVVAKYELNQEIQ
jgi:hypothetical protein